MFAEIAGRYDLMNHVLSASIDRYWRWQAVRRLRPCPGAPVLDVCTGTGDLALAFWRATEGEVPVVGADFCRPMLGYAAAKKQRQRIDGTLTFVEADALALPFADEQFQLVVVAFGLRNLADARQGLREMWRVCQPGGRLGVLEFSLPEWQPLRASVDDFPAGRQLADWIEECGWSKADWRPLSAGIATLYTATK
jgi:demethylmenaquinone methyltransferase/2-methoxy-6-polyprenyl-1,4-benzoquinol methylase